MKIVIKTKKMITGGCVNETILNEFIEMNPFGEATCYHFSGIKIIIFCFK